MAKDDKRAQDLKTEWEYPYNQVTQTLGGHEIHYNSTPDKESYRHFTPGGTYTEVDKTGREIHFVADNRFTVHANGHSQTNEGVHDNLVLGGVRDNILSAFHGEVAGDFTRGVHGTLLNVVKGMSFHHSTGNHETSVVGNKIEDTNDGAGAFNVMGPTMVSYLDNVYNIMQKDQGNFVQGNMDFKAVQKARFASDQDLTVFSKQDINIGKNGTSSTKSNNVKVNAQQEITIESEQTITIKVGQSSITISSNKIEIKSNQIKINGQAATDVSGSPLKLNGGGAPGVPTTIP